MERLAVHAHERERASHSQKWDADHKKLNEGQKLEHAELDESDHHEDDKLPSRHRPEDAVFRVNKLWDGELIWHMNEVSGVLYQKRNSALSDLIA